MALSKHYELVKAGMTASIRDDVGRDNIPTFAVEGGDIGQVTGQDLLFGFGGDVTGRLAHDGSNNRLSITQDFEPSNDAQRIYWEPQDNSSFAAGTNFGRWDVNQTGPTPETANEFVQYREFDDGNGLSLQYRTAITFDLNPNDGTPNNNAAAIGEFTYIDEAHNGGGVIEQGTFADGGNDGSWGTTGNTQSVTTNTRLKVDDTNDGLLHFQVQNVNDFSTIMVKADVIGRRASVLPQAGIY